MSSAIVKSSVWSGGSGNNHSNQVYLPQSCVGYQSKVGNLERTIANLEAEFDAALDHARYVGHLNTGLLIASVVKDSCIAFLDVGASILDAMGMKQAAKTASIGVKAIEISETSAKLYHGQISGAQATSAYANSAAGLMPTNNVTQQATQFVVKKHTGAADMMVNAPKRNKQQNQDAAIKYVADQVVSTADLIAEAGKSSGEAWGTNLGGVMNGVKGLMAAQNYSNALEKTFDTHLEEKAYVDGLIARAETQFRPKIKALKTQLEGLKRQVQSCINTTSEANGQDAVFQLSPTTPSYSNFSPAFPQSNAWPGVK